MPQHESHSSVIKVVRLLILLSGSKAFSKQEIIERLELSERSFYRYIKTLRDEGFVIEIDNTYYQIAKKSLQFKEISSLLHFSDEEAYILNEAIHNIDASTKDRENLISKLSALYDSDRISAQFVSKENSSKIKPLVDAMHHKKQVRLIDYKSSGGGSITTRLVEPFEFTHNYISLWCYELSSKANKLFKISRVQKVEIIENSWECEQEHKANLLDCFRIGGKIKIPVKLELSLKAANLLSEEYPLAEQFIKRINDNLYAFDGWITAYDGIGRFIMGLPGEVFRIESAGLVEFLKNKQKSL
jgi:predicted DNA-binding transcriptional regulator YafY